MVKEYYIINDSKKKTETEMQFLMRMQHEKEKMEAKAEFENNPLINAFLTKYKLEIGKLKTHFLAQIEVDRFMRILELQSHYKDSSLLQITLKQFEQFIQEQIIWIE
jgi:hypothetical protein